MKKNLFIILLLLAAGGVIWLWASSQTSKSTTYQTEQTKPRGEETFNMKIQSSAFGEGQPIPKKYTCDGDGVNPPLNFSDIPSKTQSLALIVDDPDAPAGTWVHWLVWDMDPAVTSLAENSAPSGATQGKTSFGQNVYGGPCPPAGQHRYYFKLYALDTKLKLPSYSTVAELNSAMQGHIITQAELMGTYGR